MKPNLVLQVFIIFVISIIAIVGCREDCSQYNTKELQIVFNRNGINVSSEFKSSSIILSDNRKFQNAFDESYQLEYDSIRMIFHSEINELCPNDDLEWNLCTESVTGDTDKLSFESNAIDSRNRCNDCEIIEITSENGNGVEISSQRILISINL